MEVVQMMPPLGCGGGNKAECRDAGLLDDKRAWQRLCLPWVAWEEGDLGGEPGRGQLTLSWWTAPGERKQPGLCREWQHGALGRSACPRGPGNLVLIPAFTATVRLGKVTLLLRVQFGHIRVCGRGQAGLPWQLRSPKAVCLLLLPPFGSLILEPDLHTSFWEIDPGRQLVADMDVRIVSEVEDLFQLLQLLCGEGGSDPPLTLLPLFGLVLWGSLWLEIFSCCLPGSLSTCPFRPDHIAPLSWPL